MPATFLPSFDAESLITPYVDPFYPTLDIISQNPMLTSHHFCLWVLNYSSPNFPVILVSISRIKSMICTLKLNIYCDLNKREKKMELKGNFLQQFQVRDTRLTVLSSNKRASLLVVGLFTREPLPPQFYRWKNLEVHCNNDQSIQHLARSKNASSKMPELSFDRLQLTDQECTGMQRRDFGRFVARQAILDEEYWTAAWLRAEAHWESLSYMRHVDSYKRKYAEEEFYALKRRCFGQEGNSLNCFCFVAIKKEDKNCRRTVLNSIVGTLDLSIKQFMQGETHPGEIKKLSAVLASREPCDTHKYAYIANVCVAKFARRQRIASNMLYLATDAATMAGMKQLFVHVNADNKPAQDLYIKTGFKVVEEASSPRSKDQRILMSMEL